MAHTTVGWISFDVAKLAKPPEGGALSLDVFSERRHRHESLHLQSFVSFQRVEQRRQSFRRHPGLLALARAIHFNQHRLGPVVYWSIPADEVAELTIGVGALAGLNASTPDATLKLSLEFEF